MNDLVVGDRVRWKRSKPDEHGGRVVSTDRYVPYSRGQYVAVEWDEGAPDWWADTVPRGSLIREGSL
jgi:hypothetical protein